MRLHLKIMDSQIPQPQFDAILVSANDNPDHLRRQCTQSTHKKLFISLLKAKDRNRTEAQNHDRLKKLEIAYRVLDYVRLIYVSGRLEIH